MNDENKPIEVRPVKAADFATIYANSAQIFSQTWDFTMIFGRILGTEGNVVHIEQSVQVLMSPQHAKAFLNFLSDNVREYEKIMGEIKLVPQPRPEEKASRFN